MHILYSVQTRTHPGKVRENNEDAFGTAIEWKEKLGLSDDVLQQRGHLFAVADGMGGHAAGEVASQLAIETLFTRFYTDEWENPRRTLAAAIESANQAIWKMAETNANLGGMGTTLVAALYRPDKWLIANIGDSRAYLFRAGRITQITRDHSWVAEQVKSGILSEQEAARHPFRNVITRSLGNGSSVESDFFEQTAQPGDIMLLCSDGLSNLASEREMQELLAAYPLDEAGERLLELALERGASDNVTFELIQLVGEARRRSRSILPWFAFAVTMLFISAFVYWNFLRSPADFESDTTKILNLSITPDASTAELAAPAVTRIIATPEPSRMLMSIGASLERGFPSIFYTETGEPVMTMVSGLVTVEPASSGDEADLITISGIHGLNGEQSFQALLDRRKYVDGPLKTNDPVAMVGYAPDGWEKGTGGIALEPVLVLLFRGGAFPEQASYRFQVSWQVDGDALETFLDRFGLSKELISEDDPLILQVGP